MLHLDCQTVGLKVTLSMGDSSKQLVSSRPKEDRGMAPTVQRLKQLEIAGEVPPGPLEQGFRHGNSLRPAQTDAAQPLGSRQEVQQEARLNMA